MLLNSLTGTSLVSGAYVRTGVLDMDKEKESPMPSVRDLPASVMVEVFANLSLRDLLRCRQVGKDTYSHLYVYSRCTYHGGVGAGER